MIRNDHIAMFTTSLGVNLPTTSALPIIITTAETPGSSSTPCSEITSSGVSTGLNKSDDSSQTTSNLVAPSSRIGLSIIPTSMSTSKSPSSSTDIKSTTFISSTSSSISSSLKPSGTSISSLSQSSNSISVAISPTSTPKQTCNSGSNKFMARDDMMNQIDTFCQEAAKQGTQDKDSGSILRTYNQGGRYEVDLAIDWPSGIDITHDMKNYCSNNMTTIMDTCDSDAARNPSNWNTGGTLQIDPVTYRITPQSNQNYTAGKCWFHLEEFKSFSGPSNEQVIFKVHIRNITDGIGNDIPVMGNGEDGSKDITKVAGDGNPYVFNTTLPFPIVITPELNGNPSDYIQFVYGSQSWTTSVNSGMPNCIVGGWTNPGTSLGAISFIIAHGSEKLDGKCKIGTLDRFKNENYCNVCYDDNL
ncbi:hypothetical protein BGAL_0048g00390 [Botrytis galanthina]|uniref:Uncharacterized protein n=1 Tax=Botrytis galanthina TaxID=278940 RepID=A0A4S8R956_9HELO|nr:hypothetical protein BGAL_0048g00390 [Botrytis galanthina]